LHRLHVALAFFCVALLPSVIAAQQSSDAPAQASTLTAAQLEAFSGEYTDPKEPDTPQSFYVQDGRLFIESERRVPTELTLLSATEFAVKGDRFKLRFTFDAAGRPVSVIWTDEPESHYQRTGMPVHHVFHDYQRSEVMIPMRDGVKLHAVILKPADIAGPLPFLIQRTPYGVDGTNRASFFWSRSDLARDGYICIAEDIRGRFKSEAAATRAMKAVTGKTSGTVTAAEKKRRTVKPPTRRWLVSPRGRGGDKNKPGHNLTRGNTDKNRPLGN